MDTLLQNEVGERCEKRAKPIHTECKNHTITKSKLKKARLQTREKKNHSLLREKDILIHHPIILPNITLFLTKYIN